MPFRPRCIGLIGDHRHRLPVHGDTGIPGPGEGQQRGPTLTACGLEDPDTAIEQPIAPPITAEAELEAVRQAILGNLAD